MYVCTVYVCVYVCMYESKSCVCIQAVVYVCMYVCMKS